MRALADIDAELDHERVMLRIERRSGEKTNGTLRALDRLDELLEERFNVQSQPAHAAPGISGTHT